MHLAPIPVSGGRDWLHRRRTADTTSQYPFLPGAGPYLGSCWHQGDFLKVHHVVISAHPSLCSEGKPSEFFFIVRRPFPSGVLVCRPSERGISIGTSSFCTWDCGRRCLSILGAVRPQLPPEWALCFCRSLFFSESVWMPVGCCYSRNTVYLLDDCPRLVFVAVDTLLLAWLSWKGGIDIVVFPALSVFGSKILLLEALNLPCSLSLEVLKTHEPG
jgi:hypothetical protein